MRIHGLGAQAFYVRMALEGTDGVDRGTGTERPWVEQQCDPAEAERDPPEDRQPRAPAAGVPSPPPAHWAPPRCSE